MLIWEGWDFILKKGKLEREGWDGRLEVEYFLSGIS